jgi:hypothetical protein
MAGDWIKMNKSLPRDPRVVRISSALKADRLRTVGGLLSAWCLADEQTEDGKLDGYTPGLLDELIGFPGLSMAMQSVGWLDVGDGFLVIPRFEEHNGQSAKRRAQDSTRKMSARKPDICPQSNPTICGPEKRREEKNKKSMAKPSIEEIATFCKTIGLPESDGKATFWKWEGNGWMNGKVPVKNWKATIRQWKESGWMPSIKNPTNETGTRPIKEETRSRSLFD